jgi:nucleotide-binding universal stress UspA family protein
MFTRILVPLDGSWLAEAALPAAEALHKDFHSSITLIHLMEKDAPREVHGERHLHDEKEAGAYLEETARRYFPADAKVDTHVHAEGVSDVPLSLSEHSKELGQDLIIMSVHGHGGLPRMLEGNFAQRIVELRTVPVLLVRPTTASPSVPSFGRILVALDGKPEHEQGLHVAAGLAERSRGTLVLLTVVPTWITLMGERRAAGRLLPAATAELLEISEQSAKDYLGQHAQALTARRIPVEAVVKRGSPARKICRVAAERNADLIVLGTHGKAGADAFWAGSVAARVVSRAPVPLLLVPLPGTAT